MSIMKSQALRDFEERGIISLDNTNHKVSASVDKSVGALIQRMVELVRPSTYLEVGLAFGISALYAQDALRRMATKFTHVVIDPYQTSSWGRVGIRLLERDGVPGSVQLVEKSSELALADLCAAGTTIDIAFIDGYHTFDHTLVDFFFINKMLRVGGIVIFDDCIWPSVGKVVFHVETYPGYKRVDSAGQKSLLRKAGSVLRRMSLTGTLPRAVAIQKKAADDRTYSWYKRF